MAKLFKGVGNNEGHRRQSDGIVKVTGHHARLLVLGKCSLLDKVACTSYTAMMETNNNEGKETNVGNIRL
jgi:hypothetical protein